MGLFHARSPLKSTLTDWGTSDERFAEGCCLLKINVVVEDFGVGGNNGLGKDSWQCRVRANATYKQRQSARFYNF